MEPQWYATSGFTEMGSRGTRIGKAYKRADDRLRSVFFDTNCLKIYSQSTGPYITPVESYDNGWFVDEEEFTDIVSGKKFKYLTIEDVTGCRLQTLRDMTHVQVQDVIYKVANKDSFIGSVPSYEFKLQPTGERV